MTGTRGAAALVAACLVSGLGGPAAPSAGAAPPAADFFAPAGAAPAELPAAGIFPRGRRLAFMGYSGDPARDVAAATRCAT